jgi:hypothetical protein
MPIVHKKKACFCCFLVFVSLAAATYYLLTYSARKKKKRLRDHRDHKWTTLSQEIKVQWALFSGLTKINVDVENF